MIGLFEIFKSADGSIKLNAFTLIRSIFKEGIKKYPQCLPSLLSLMSPCLSSSNEDLNDSTWEFMTWLRDEFQEFFFGSLWMSLKRNSSGRMGLISFLRETIRSNSNWMETRKVEISEIQNIINEEKSDKLDMKIDNNKENQKEYDEETEGSTLFEDSDHEEETEMESKLKIYLDIRIYF